MPLGLRRQGSTASALSDVRLTGRRIAVKTGLDLAELAYFCLFSQRLGSQLLKPLAGRPGSILDECFHATNSALDAKTSLSRCIDWVLASPGWSYR